MNPAEAAVLLAAISANDNREVGEAGARAWSAALPDIDLHDALKVLPAFYRSATRNTKNWIFPGDVVAGVVELHAQQRKDVGEQARIEAASRRAIKGGANSDQRFGGDMDIVALRARQQACLDFDDEHLPKCPACSQAVQRRHVESKRKNTEAWG